MMTGLLERRLLVPLVKRLLQIEFGGGLIPLERIMRVRELLHGDNALFPILESIRATGDALNNSFLSSQLADVELGSWSLAAASLNFLEHQIHSLSPRLILEFGSGVSTACLARYMQDVHGDSDRLYVVSIEQDLKYLRSALSLLETLSLRSCVRILHAPLSEQEIEGTRTTCYELPTGMLHDLLHGVLPDFVLIDGPAGGSATRYGTLPLARPFLAPEAWFFLDDALRDGELRVASMWNDLPYVKLLGVRLCGKGLLQGQMSRNL